MQSLMKIALYIDPEYRGTVKEELDTLCSFIMTKHQEPAIAIPQEPVVASPPQLIIHPVATENYPPLYSSAISHPLNSSVESPRIYNPMPSYSYPYSMKSFRWSDVCDEDDIDKMSDISYNDEIDPVVHVTKLGPRSETVSAAMATFVSAPKPSPVSVPNPISKPIPASLPSEEEEEEEEEEVEEEEEEVELDELEEEEDDESIQIQEEHEEVEDENGTTFIELLLTNDTLCYREPNTDIVYNDEFEEIGTYDPITKRITLTK